MRYILALLLVLSLAGCATTTIPHAVSGGAATYVPGGSFAWPLKGEVVEEFGSKTDYVINKGVDIRADDGSPVRASRRGTVVFTDEQMEGFGKTVIIDHGNNYQTVYAFNSAILVNVGETVEQNAVIAKAGKTGRAKGSGLHFEIRKDGRPVDPIRYLKD